GTLLQAEGNNSHDRLRDLPEGHWTGRREENPGGPLTQLGVHVADNLIYLLGPVKRVSSFSNRMCQGWDVPDVTGTLLEFHSGLVGYIGSNYASPRWTAYTNLYGERASLYYDRFDGLRCLERGRPEKVSLEFPEVDIVEEELLEFARSMATGIKPETDGQVGLQALAVVRGAILSAERGEAVEVDELLEGGD
ncbi:MAG: Gfo/Idh/MocA family protein, partial [Nitrospinota bacterium]